MLLTKLIPPKSRQIKEAVNIFNRFLEEPQENKKERLELLISGGRGCGKSTIASGMLIKACGESKANGFCLCTSNSSVKCEMEQLVWSLNQLEEAYDISMVAQSFTLLRSKSKIYGLGINIGMLGLAERTIAIPNKRFVWIDSAEEIESEKEYANVINSLNLQENPIVILTYTPNPSKTHWLNVYEQEILCSHNGSGNRWVFKPAYIDMEKHMLGKKFFQNAEQLRIYNPKAYCHEYLGIPTNI